MDVRREERPVRDVSRVFGVAAQFVVTVIADREQIIRRLQSTGHFPDEIVDLTIFRAVLRTANRIFVRDFVGPNDVKDEHVDGWIGLLVGQQRGASGRF